MNNYYSPTPPLGAYYVPAVTKLAPAQATALASSDFSMNISAPTAISLILWTAVRTAAGYYVGKFFNHPVAGALAGGIFGLPGVFVVALVSNPHASVAVPNRRRRHHRKHR